MNKEGGDEVEALMSMKTDICHCGEWERVLTKERHVERLQAALKASSRLENMNLL